MKEYIIDQPHLVSTRNRVVWGLVTAVFWLFWAYLWLPLITLLAWYFGVTAFIDQVLSVEGLDKTFRLIALYVLIVLVIGLLFIGWAALNWYRFRGVDRRRPRPPIDDVGLAGYYQLPPERMPEWRAGNRIVAYHDDAGRIVDIKVLQESDPAPWQLVAISAPASAAPRPSQPSLAPA
jgi:biofilm PGA synthesis protein PgaD